MSFPAHSLESLVHQPTVATHVPVLLGAVNQILLGERATKYAFYISIYLFSAK
jgi:hypothetical protein